ncbi:MAG: zf-HC2 domain-containing protein [Eubacteriales bacterium]
MTCKDAEKMIPVFLKQELNNKTMKEFLKHVETCENCKEELSIQYLVMAGTVILETGNSFDLNEELENMIAEAKKGLKQKRILTIGLYLFEICAIAAVIGILLAVIFG